ncbi:DUF1080 domain-containing protein [Fulvivirga sp. M361]|uniref:3-keto-disaccharide hydrolase n=1 Tax=Fulvivirga sp. M361 TaxID=2594266 RepID=UPI00117AFEB1|nr:DUF1080 domain-containing protein [Fulvivirga sp. M361]TRX52452.1 DUF1080 domain-containing protein [Fulvivirga sp. M361]
MKYPIIFAILCSVQIAYGQTEKDPAVTEIWTPQPVTVTPGKTPGSPPSDAIVLFDGNSLEQWVHDDGSPVKWELKDGAVTVKAKTGQIKTIQTFEDVQLHIEWRTPENVESDGQGRGNSGIFLQERYEVQVLDNFENKTYANGQAGSIYKQHAPLVNACKEPGEWQTYDIIYKAPDFNDRGNLRTPARITVLHNGVLIQNNVEIRGPSVYRGLPQYQSHKAASITLQDHGNPVSYRNIWVRQL